MMDVAQDVGFMEEGAGLRDNLIVVYFLLDLLRRTGKSVQPKNRL